MAARADDSADLPFTLRIPHSTFRIAMPVQAIAWSPSGAVRIVDQRALPEAKIERDLETGEAVADAIRTLQLRGAPLIGIAAAMGLVAGTRELRAAPRDRFLGRLDELARLLGATRPTAVNLRWALDRMTRVAAATPADWGGAALWERLQAEATAIWEEDRAMCRRIGEAGLPLIPDGAKLLTHCNAGALATGGIGTALAPIYLAHEAGRRVHVFVDETRPVLQGARLTAWELVHAGIPCTVMADAVAGSLMRRAQVDLVIVGADRIAANGDFANKIGTYPLAVLALHHGVPFYCAAPSTTIDTALTDGDGIPIEQRGPEEVKTMAGRPVAPAAAAAINPAFDVTPARYVTGFVTDRGLEKPPFHWPAAT
jgi:methylthioribose-1-phosphate isomerase